MESPYRHWTTGIIAGVYLLFTLLYLPYYVPKLFEPFCWFPLTTHVGVIATLACTLTYFFASPRWGHHGLMLLMAFWLGCSSQKHLPGDASFCLIAMALLAVTLVRAIIQRGRVATSVHP
jgi:hypothetical protein